MTRAYDDPVTIRGWQGAPSSARVRRMAQPLMHIETHRSKHPHPVQSVADIRAAIALVSDRDEAKHLPFVILQDLANDQVYLQACGPFAETGGFRVEHRAGGAGEHYCADRHLQAAELEALMIAYWGRVKNWDLIVPWHRMIADPDARPTA